MKTRRLFLLAAAATLTACGFQPSIDTAQHNKASYYSQFALPDANNDESFALRRRLVAFFGEPLNPRFAIKTAYSSSASTLKTESPTAINRRQLSATATFTVTDLRSGQLVYTREFQRKTSFTSSGDALASAQRLQGAQRQLAEFIATQFATDMIARFPNL